MLLSKFFSGEEDQFVEEEDGDERAISEEEDWHENEVKDIQGKIFKENQFRKTADADMGGTPSMSNSQN